MSVQPHNPATVAAAVEKASQGITGIPQRTGRGGANRPATVTLTPREAYEAIHGTPQRETVVGHVCYSGGVAHVLTDGKIGRVETKAVAYTVVVDPETGETAGECEITTEWRMIPTTTRREYAPGITADIAELGTERNRYVPQPIPAPRPSGSVYHATPEWTPDVETYRERLAEYYATR